MAVAPMDSQHKQLSESLSKQRTGLAFEGLQLRMRVLPIGNGKKLSGIHSHASFVSFMYLSSAAARVAEEGEFLPLEGRVPTCDENELEDEPKTSQELQLGGLQN